MDMLVGRRSGEIPAVHRQEAVGDGDVPVTTPLAFNPGAFSCGANPGSPSLRLCDTVPVHRHAALSDPSTSAAT